MLVMNNLQYSMDLTIIKRNGNKTKFDAEKINRVVEWATENIKDVNKSDVIMRAKLSLTDNITSSSIHDALIAAAEDLISVETPNYEKVAKNLLNYKLRKLVWGGKNPPKLIHFISRMTEDGYWDKSIFAKYSEKDINKIDEMIDHERDFLFPYGGITQMMSKYLVQNRKIKQILETPQFLIIGMAMTLFADEQKDRLDWIKQFYTETSKQMSVNWPTPILSGARTPTKSYSSCCLIDVLDTKESLFAANTAAGMVTCDKYGVGLNLSRIRPINSPIKKGETLHSGVVAWLKMFRDTIKCCQQGGARRGSGTVTFPIFHPEILSILQLKNNQGTHENRVHDLDYCISISKLFWDRIQKKSDISLFSSVDVPDLYEKFGTEEFDELYLKYENDLSIPRTIVSNTGLEGLSKTLFTERMETARIYILNVDNANRYSPWKDVVHMTNLCVEILHPLKAERYTNDPEAEIGVCVLAATNMTKIKNDEHHKKVCKLIVKVLNNLIDCQEYTTKGLENFAKNKRSIGVGVTNFSAWLARDGLNHNSPEALEKTNEYFEKQQYYLMEASMELAKETSPAPHFSRSKYYNAEKSPLDLYCKEVDKLVKSHNLDWSGLMENIAKYGMKNMTLTAVMPVESSSVMQGTTNGVEPITSLIIKKSSLEKTAIQIVPGIDKFSDNYLKKSDIKDNTGIIKINAVIAKWLDMASSFNLYYDSEGYPEGNIPLSVILKDHLMATHYGLKTFYYCNSKKKQDSLAAAEKEQGKEYTDEQKRLLSRKYTEEEQKLLAEAEAIRSLMTDNEKSQRKLWGTSITTFNQHDGYGYEDEGGCSSGACSL